MDEMFARLVPLYEQQGIEKLQNTAVAVFGLGGVGGIAAEALVRSGIGKITLVDGDSFDTTNLNRQLFSLHSTIGERKCEVAAKRLGDINPKVKIDVVDEFITVDNIDQFEFERFDYVIDAIDTVTTKLLLIERCVAAGTKIVSCMGTGGKTDLTLLKLDMIENSHGCPLARVMRRELKKREIFGIDVVYSPQERSKGHLSEERHKNASRPAPSSCIFVPSAAGLLLAQHVVNQILSGD